MKNKELKEFVYNNVYQNTANGYVLTPSELAFEMVSKLPESVFESESTTFLDPICKSGTFLFEIVERLYDKGHSVKNIESRIYTIDSNFHSLNVAKSTIRQILNKCSGSFKIDYTNDWIERFYNRSISHISQGKYTTFDDFMNIIILDKNKKELMALLKNSISDFIQQYEKVSKLESKLFGEVFTPRQLIEEMLDTLPEDVWTNKDLKWLDPAVGIGNFPSVVLDRLMVGLEDVIPNEGERRKHILEEMLYMCDISIKNLFLLYKLFDCNNEFKLNVHRGSFLDENLELDIKNKWNIDEFDIIIGNPPYNTNGTGTGNSIWHLFLEKSNKISKRYICFIHPCSWRMPLRKSDRFYNVSKIIKNNITYLRILKKEEANKYFGLSIKVDFYLLDKNKTSDISIVETSDEKVSMNLKDMSFIPNYNFDFFERLMNSDTKCNVIYSSTYDPRSRYVSREQDETFIYPLVLSTPKAGIRYAYSSVNDKGHFGIPKVIFGDSGINHVIIDMEGLYGMTQHGIGLEVSSLEEATSIKEVLVSDKFSKFLESVMWSNFQIDYRLFKELKKDFWKEFIKE